MRNTPQRIKASTGTCPPPQTSVHFCTPLVVVVVVVEWFSFSKRIITVRWADLSDFCFR